MCAFVAGASRAICEPLIAELLKQGHSVVGMTSRAATLALGVHPLVALFGGDMRDI